jgi:hypothetical protein
LQKNDFTVQGCGRNLELTQVANTNANAQIARDLLVVVKLQSQPNLVNENANALELLWSPLVTGIAGTAKLANLKIHAQISLS